MYTAYERLGGLSLTHRAVHCLDRSAAVARILLTVPAGLVDRVRDVATAAGSRPIELDPAGIVPVELVPAGLAEDASPLDLIAAALSDRALEPDHPVLIHDPRCALAPPELVRDVLAALDRNAPEPDPKGPEAAAGRSLVIAVRPVTDTLTWVDGDRRMLGTADRDRYRSLCSPLAAPAALLRVALARRSRPDAGSERARPGGLPVMPGADPRDLEALPELVRSAGGRLVPVPAPAAAVRVTTALDLIHAELVLAGLDQPG